MKNKKTANNNECTRTSMPVLHISESALVNILKTVGQQKAETGGVLGGQAVDEIITHFHFDESAENSSATYSPDCDSINELLKNNWSPNDIKFCGFVHSHPGIGIRPSEGDEIYAERILKANEELDFLWLPIVHSVANTGAFRMVPWAVYLTASGVEIVEGNINVVEETGQSCMKPLESALPYNEELKDIALGREILSTITEKTADLHVNVETNPLDEISSVSSEQSKSVKDVSNATFERVEDAYDLQIMKKTRLVVVGVGGAAAWIEETARTGISQFVLIDHDIVEEANLATQQVYRRDINRAKVDCLAERITDINPEAHVVALQKDFLDMNDKEFELLITGTFDGQTAEQSVICGFSDNFFVQARVNRLALKFGIPSLCAQVYEQGRGAEITFTYPGVTWACHRCILRARYNHYIYEKQDNPVTSKGTPVFATSRLNALKGFVLLAMLHHGSNHPRWGQMLKIIGNRNLVQIRMDPDLAHSIGIEVFDNVFDNADKERLLFDETVWLPQKPIFPVHGGECRDCGSTGNLYDSVGRFSDTRNLSNRKLRRD